MYSKIMEKENLNNPIWSLLPKVKEDKFRKKNKDRSIKAMEFVPLKNSKDKIKILYFELTPDEASAFIKKHHFEDETDQKTNKREAMKKLKLTN